MTGKRGQVGIEIMVGGVVFLFFFLAVSSYLFAQNIDIENKLLDIEQEKKCKEFSQILYQVKNGSLSWSGTLDHNFYINDSTVLINYNPPTPFSGIYCNTISTNLTQALTNGDINISYSIEGGFVFEQ